ncbi:pyruvate kinase [Leptospira gomenensis]|uniref:Pyruvate kinase n=1 Tax=Leptospira gomenensis TaxID=2484974 RepID=A0A5F1YU06_9LEPT|nr:pyruvate kinase [Leptospira gomenensis]TGK31715.1 pyruvate kinase [Leptospira gomenensis]TGK36094.1 pyruvate kinase [Leptospira gomenensis]TGK41656.1 pyruvate kinase [Leptospira gomenensis]TGK61384.1 pyruvate kinase [Leptospira gomenensis]
MKIPNGKKTKIVCTIGPASSSEETILSILKSGMDIARMNFSHGSHESHKRVYDTLRKCEQISGSPLGIMADLQGPKIRTGKLKLNSILLHKDQEIEIVPDAEFQGDEHKIGCTYPNLIQDIQVGDRILIDDGKLVLRVLSKTEQSAILKVNVGGILWSNKGINLPGTPISAPALSEKDKEDLKFALSLGVDYIALSFVRSAADLELARTMLQGSETGLIAKIERPEALDNIESIIERADGIMIARGDLGVEIETEKVPILQKELIYKLNQAGKPVITATQMLESMIENPRPTRAEASDVANAVMDGTDAVMLSAESASGHYPVESVEIMSRIIQETESIDHIYEIHWNVKKTFLESERTALGHAAREIAHEINAKAIVNFTRSGYSSLITSEMRPKVPIYSFTPFMATARKMKLYRGVVPFVMPFFTRLEDMLAHMNQKLKEDELLYPGDKLVILSGAPGANVRSVDFLQIYRIH